MKFRSLLGSMGFIALATIAGPASAVRNGVNLTISALTVSGPENKATIAFASGVSGVSLCSSAGKANHFAIDLTSDKGKAQLSLATNAMLFGHTVNVASQLLNGVSDQCTSVFGNQVQILDQITLNP
jgi:hypothetical protein